MTVRLAVRTVMNVVNALIVEALRRPGWNQARLARALQLRPQTVNKWVKGENTPPLERWASIEAALGIEPGTLMHHASEGLPPVPYRDASEEAAQLRKEVDALKKVVSQLIAGQPLDIDADVALALGVEAPPAGAVPRVPSSPVPTRPRPSRRSAS